MARGNLRRDFSAARAQMRYPRPIPTIDEQFSHAGGMYQGAVGWLNVRAFLQALRLVRRARRARKAG
ncbi:MAG TPA: hypothetical protein VGI86_11455 [Acidimicrobiia bacterium]|jgi:hypothetical protein